MVKSFNYLKVLPVLTLLLLLTGCFSAQSYVRPPKPNMPRTYVAEYNRVWNSALDVLDEKGYVIVQMDKVDGYISTMMKEDDSYRSKVSLRIVGVGNKVTVKVNWYSQEKRSTTDSSGARLYYWGVAESGGYGEKWIKDKIAEKLGLTQ